MLTNKKMKAFVPTLDPEKAKEFYTKVLELKLLSSDKYGIEFDANGTLLRINTVREYTPHPFTVLGWNVDDISATIQALNKKGVHCEKYSFLEQDEMGVWLSPGGSKVAWFKDPDGNTLSVSEHFK